jgi:hypothetical protein
VGPVARISISPPRGYHGDVDATLVADDLAAALQPR